MREHNSAIRRTTGDARVDALISWYSRGLFPMAQPPTGEIGLFTADPRGVLPLEERSARAPAGLRVSRSLTRAMRNRGFLYTIDTRFEDVIRMCAEPRSQDEGEEQDSAWLTPELIDWYLAAHSAGYAHSVEVLLTDPATGEHHLVGGVYGLAIGSGFFAESMAHRPRPRLADGTRHPLDGSDASKAALVTLVRHLRACGFTLLDTQMVTDHVARFGGFEIPASRYEALLARAIADEDRWRTSPLPPGIAPGGGYDRLPPDH